MEKGGKVQSSHNHGSRIRDKQDPKSLIASPKDQNIFDNEMEEGEEEVLHMTEIASKARANVPPSTDDVYRWRRTVLSFGMVLNFLTKVSYWAFYV